METGNLLPVVPLTFLCGRFLKVEFFRDTVPPSLEHMSQLGDFPREFSLYLVRFNANLSLICLRDDCRSFRIFFVELRDLTFLSMAGCE